LVLRIESHPVFASAGGKKQQPDGNDATTSTESVVSKAKPGGVIAALSQQVAPKNKTLPPPWPLSPDGQALAKLPKSVRFPLITSLSRALSVSLCPLVCNGLARSYGGCSLRPCPRAM